jgi:beta-galactosidase
MEILCRTGRPPYSDREAPPLKPGQGTIRKQRRAEIISGLIGAQVEFFDNLPPSQTAKVLFNNQAYEWNTWAEGLKVHNRHIHWPLLATNFTEGQTAATRKEYGKGSVTYLSVITNDKKLESDVLKEVFTRASIPIENYPPGVIIDWVNGMWIGVNYSDKPYQITKSNSQQIFNRK